MKKACLLFMVIIGIAAAVYGQTTVRSDPLYIFFSANSADLTKVSPELAIQNSQAFTRVAQILLDNPQYRLLIDGHANAVDGTIKEEIEALRPLSMNRATVVADFLVKYYGIDKDRLIVSAFGSTYPVTTNPQEAYKNRSVVFLIIPAL
jgi:outer membrane protein OmpA-like peptidoglycan-associated protein